MRPTVLLIAIFFSIQSLSQTFNVSNYTRNMYSTTFYKVIGVNDFYLEVPPWVIKGGWYQYFLTTNFTGMWSTTKSLATPFSENIWVGLGDSYGPNWILSSSHWWDGMIPDYYLNSPNYIYHYQWMNYHWRRNYNGVFSAHILSHAPTGQQIIFATSHGENRNERYELNCYQNTVRPSYHIDCNDPNTYSGTPDGIVFYDHWPSYAGFLNGNWIPYTAATDWGNTYLGDLGPIGWPSAGYLNPDSSQASQGLRHPSSIVVGNYVYIYVRDHSMDGTGGVKLFRAAIEDVLNPLAFQTWSSIDGWIAALPAAFHKDNAANFFMVRGPQNTAVFNTPYNTVRFSVAHFKNTNEYIGVEQYNASETSMRVALRSSTDLINWSAPIDIYEINNWNGVKIKYPIFLSKDGMSNTEIDKDEFYVVGSESNTPDNGRRINKLHFKWYTPPPPPPPDPCTEYLVSPNPAKNMLTIARPPCPIESSVALKYSIEVIDLNGAVRKSRKNITFENTYSIDLTGLLPGNYIVYISDGKKKVAKHLKIE